MRLVIFSLLAALTAGPGPLFASDSSVETKICEDVVLHGREELNFTSSELHLLCGDTKARDWQKIPRSQALFHLKTFLQARGYYYPEEIPHSGKFLEVRLGEPTLVTELDLRQMPKDVESWTATEFNGERLTPDLLKTIGEKLSHRLGTIGYGCPELETEANPKTGRVRVTLKSGRKQNLAAVHTEDVRELAPGTLRRYDAFVIGGTFNASLLPLTASRAVSDGIVRNTYFNVKCDVDGVNAEQKVMAGKPRQVTIGFGLNTDRGLSARASWKHSRLGARGSQVSVAATVSYRGYAFHSQQIESEAKWYFLSEPSRLHFKPRLLLRRQSDNRLDVIGGEISFAPASTWDTQKVGWTASIGPNLRGERTLRGEGRRQTFFFSLVGNVSVMSHDFEWQRTEPRTGYEWTSTLALNRKGFLADYTASSWQTRFTHLWALSRRSRRQYILGVRAGLATTFVRNEEGGLNNLTISLRHFLGGAGNLRGFGFQELPGPSGALTSFFTSAELRSTGLLPWDLQPYIFVDAGTVSPRTMDVTAKWYTSPGFGLRWPSPVGVFRLSGAHGFTLGSHPTPDPNSHWQVHFTYGEEF